MRPVLPNRLLHSALCGLVALSLSGCPFDKPEDHLARGKELAAKQDHVGAIIELKNFLQTRPKSSEARFLLGREMLAQNFAKSAEIELQKAYDGKYDRDAVVPLLVRSQVMQGLPERIAPEFAKLELKSPAANAELMSLLGSGALLQDKTDVALKYFRAAEQFQPDYPAARLGEARIKAVRGDYDGASADVSQLLAKNPKDFDSLLLKADIARAHGTPKEMIEAYLAASKENPSNLPVRINLASAYLASDSFDAAQQQIVELKKLAPRDPGVNYLDALLAYDKKDYLHANDAIQLSLELNPVNGTAQLLSGAISLAINQPAQGEIHLIQGLKLTPNSIFGRRLLTNLYLRQHQPSKATEVLLPALRLLPGNAVLLSLAGETAVQLGDYSSASKFFATAAQKDPTDTNVRVRAASVALARGDDAGGFAALEAAAKTDADNPVPDLALVIAHLNRGQSDQALAAWTKVEKQRPNDPVTYNLRAAIDLQRKDRAAARKALEHAVQLQFDYFPAVANLAALDEMDGEVDAAKDRYRAILKKDAKNAEAMLALAQLEARHGGKPDVVLPLLNEARRTKPTSEQPVSALVSYYLAQNNARDALATAQEALRRTPTSELFLNLNGDLQLRTGGVDQAIAAYRQLVALRPTSIEYQMRLGQAMVLANQADLAVPVFENALKAQPANSAAQVAAIDTLLNANRIDDAARLLVAIRKIAPNSAALAMLDGDFKMAAKQYADAAIIYRKVFAQTPSAAMAMKVSMALQFAGKDDAAKAVHAEWLSTHPKDADIMILDADLALRDHDYPQAIKGYRAALEVRPDNPIVMNNLALALWQQKDPTALSVVQKANELAPNRPSISDTLGWIMFEQGRTREALELLQKASAAAPSQHLIALHLAKAQIKDGRKDAAKATLQAIVRAAPDSDEGKESKALIATL